MIDLLRTTLNPLVPIALTILLQVALVTLIVLVLMWVFRRSPAGRHFAGLCGLACFVGCPVLLLTTNRVETSWLAISLAPEPVATPDAEQAPKPNPVNAGETTETDSTSTRTERTRGSSASPMAPSLGGGREIHDMARPSPAMADLPPLRSRGPERSVDDSIGTIRKESQPSAISGHQRGRNNAAANSPGAGRRSANWSIIFSLGGLLWATGTVVLLLRGVVRRLKLHRLLRLCRPATDAQLAERAAGIPAVSTSLSMTGGYWSLEHRIAGILHASRNRPTSAGWQSIAAVLSIVALTAFCAVAIVVGDETHRKQKPSQDDVSGDRSGETTMVDGTVTSAQDSTAKAPNRDGQPRSGDEEAEHLRQAAELCSKTEYALYRELRSSDDHVALSAALMLLGAATEAEAPNVLDKIAGRSWSKPQDQPVGEFTRQLEHQATARTDEPTVREPYLAKPVRFIAREALVIDRLDQLTELVPLPIWIDDAVASSGEKVAAPDTEGPWLQVLESTLQQTPYELAILPDDALWIGPREKLNVIRATYADHLDTYWSTDGLLSKRLYDHVDVLFRDTPLETVAAALAEQHDVPIEVLGLGNVPVTTRLRGVPLHMVLHRILEPIEADWWAAGQLVVVGQKEQKDAASRRQNLNLRRMARFMFEEGRILDALCEELTVQFTATRLADVAEVLAQQCEVPVTVAPSHVDRLVSIQSNETRLDQLLDILTLKLDLSWETDGRQIRIADAPETARMRNRWPSTEVVEIERPSPMGRGGEDPFGADPFAEDTAPHPFVAPKNTEQVTAERQPKTAVSRPRAKVVERPRPQLPQGTWNLLQNASIYVNRSSDDDAIALDNALQLLSLEYETGWYFCDRSPPYVLKGLVQRDWQKPDELSVHEYLIDLNRQSQSRSDKTAALLEQTKKDYQQLTEHPWPLDWRNRREMWLDLVETILEATSGQDMSTSWQKAVEGGGRISDLYRMAHLYAAREANLSMLDYDLVKPLFLSASDRNTEVFWCSETLHTLLLLGIEPSDPRYVEPRTVLLKPMQLVGGHDILLARLLGELVALARKRDTSLATKLLESMLTDAEHYVFSSAAHRSGLSTEQVRACMLAKPVEMQCEKDTLADNLAFLLDEVYLPRVRIDSEDIAEHGGLRVPAYRGQWLDVMETVLEPTPYRLFWLDRQTIWIGRPERLEATQAQYQASRARTSRAGARARSALLDGTRIEFTEVPLTECIQFLRDMHQAEIIPLTELQGEATLLLKGAPLHIAFPYQSCHWDSSMSSARADQVRASCFP